MMPKQARLDAPDTLHHVMIREIEKRQLVECHGIPLAEIARHLDVSTSAVSKIMRKGEK